MLFGRGRAEKVAPYGQVSLRPPCLSLSVVSEDGFRVLHQEPHFVGLPLHATFIPTESLEKHVQVNGVSAASRKAAPMFHLLS